VGRLAPQKDYPTLLSVAAEVSKDRPDVVFAVVGDGPLRDNLQARIDAEGLPVRLLGHRSDVADLLGASDVFLLTSHWEARALVLQEALAGRRTGGGDSGWRRTGVGRRQRSTGVPGDSRGLADGDGKFWMIRLRRPYADRSLKLAAGWPDEDEVAKNLLDIYAGLVATTA